MNIKNNLEKNKIKIAMESENMAESEQQQAIEYLKSLNPAIFNSGEINLNALKETLGLDVNNTTKGYGLSFLGKNLVQSLANRKSEYELKEELTQSKNPQTTENLILRGDNIDSLKLLNNSYKNKIKCIYIDPPYNTDGDNFVYNDSFRENEKNLIDDLALDEKDIERLGREFKNKKSHNGWLTFMYPRLKLARKLLTEDGVIFISIDDNEQANLKLLCDEIFGENNLVENFAWNCSTAGGLRPKFSSKTHENVLCYAKNIISLDVFFAPLSKEAISSYNKQDEVGIYREKDFIFKNASTNINQKYEIVCPNGDVVKPKKGYIYRFIEGTFQKAIKNNIVVFKKSKNSNLMSINTGEKSNWNIYIKKYLDKDKGVPASIISKDLVGLYNNGSSHCMSLFENKTVFQSPKPIKLITYLAKMIDSKNNDIILDFFAGSGTTGHAVMQLNAEDNGNRKYILCQWDEQINKKNKEAISFCEENNFEKVISSITIERVNRAGEQIKQDLIDQGKTEQANNLDIGYKVFSHIKAPTIEIDENSLQANMNLHQATSTQDRLTNMMLKTGVQLNQPIETIQDDCLFKINNNYYIINSEKLENKNLEQIIKQTNQDPDELNNIYIDGYTATINTTLQQYHKNIKAIL